ncbi:MAG: hypothetical protein Q4F84_02415 [Fibrobacter sp.]|nr:hypothetical protein [Fibrobacter sp.]
MVSDREKMEFLLEFVDQKIFDPVLNALPEQYSSERDRRMLRHVKECVAIGKRRFHVRSQSAKQVRENYVRELYYETNGIVGRELEDLELPRFIQLRNSFEMLCEKIGVRHSAHSEK